MFLNVFLAFSVNEAVDFCKNNLVDGEKRLNEPFFNSDLILAFDFFLCLCLNFEYNIA